MARNRSTETRPVTKFETYEPEDSPIITAPTNRKNKPDIPFFLQGKDWDYNPLKVTSKDPDYNLRWVAPKNITKRKGRGWTTVTQDDIVETHFMEHADGTLRYDSLILCKRHKAICDKVQARLDAKNRAQELELNGEKTSMLDSEKFHKSDELIEYAKTVNN